jgi:hypothetical protein
VTRLLRVTDDPLDASLIAFSGIVIDQVVAMMTHWNKVSLDSSYSIDIRFDVDEWSVRVWSVRSIGSLQILMAVVVVYERKQSDGFLYGDFDLFFWSILLQSLTSQILCPDGEGL